MPFTDFALDMMATHLSEFTAPDIPPLELRDEKTLQNNMLENVLGVFGGRENAHMRHLMTNIVRRISASAEFYEQGRENALNYIAGNRHARITPYFVALAYFESCVSYSWHIADFIRQMSGTKVFERGDGSEWERLHGIYTDGTKHSFNKYDAMARPEMPTTVWLTNSGIACVSRASITFKELSEVIAANNELFYDVQRKVRERYRAAEPAKGGEA